MIQRDYILRLIQQLVDSLFLLLDKKDLDVEEFKEQIDKIFVDYLDASSDFYLKSSLDEILVTLLKRYGEEEYLYRIEMLTEIMFQDGMSELDLNQRRVKLSKALELLLYLDNHSSIYSLVREGKIDVIKANLV